MKKIVPLVVICFFASQLNAQKKIEFNKQKSDSLYKNFPFNYNSKNQIVEFNGFKSIEKITSPFQVSPIDNMIIVIPNKQINYTMLIKVIDSSNISYMPNGYKKQEPFQNK
jgi:hypothetical protein